jgi:hypothetical protein
LSCKCMVKSLIPPTTESAAMWKRRRYTSSNKTIFSQWGEDSSTDIRLQKHHCVSTEKFSTGNSCAAQQRGGITPGPASTSRSKLIHTLVTGSFRLKNDNNLMTLIMKIQQIITELSRAA